jgi:hypothetical protein
MTTVNNVLGRVQKEVVVVYFNPYAFTTARYSIIRNGTGYIYDKSHQMKSK